MQLSNVQEDVKLERKLYLGIENFQATAVNPTMKELNDMGIPVTTEPEYVTKVLRNYGEGEEEYDATSVRIYLINKEKTIRTQVNYQIIKSDHLSSTNKLKVINKYGSSTWLEDSYIKAKTLPANMAWFVNEDVKVCLRGEDDLVAFLKAYRNLPNINLTSDGDTKKKGVAVFAQSDLDKLFKGDFSDIRNAIMGIGDKGMVGYLLGVRHLEDKDVQTLYRQSPLKRFIKKVGGNQYLTKDVMSSQENGAYADVTFNVADYSLKEYSQADKVEADSMDEYEPSNMTEDDDLPF